MIKSTQMMLDPTMQANILSEDNRPIFPDQDA